MSQYKIFKHPNEDIQSVKQGFCWPAYFFQWAWAIVSGIFVLLIFWFFSNATLSKIFPQYPNLSSADYALWGAFIIFWAIITTIPGFKANAWREKNLLSRGYELKEIITDKSKWGVITLSLKTIKSYLKGSAGKTAKIANFTGDKNLENNAYKIFLTKKYLIEKNEALGQFISQDELFNTIEEALEYANNLESEAAKIKEIKSNEALLKVKERVGHIRENLHEAIDGLEHRVKEKINTDTKNKIRGFFLFYKSFVSVLFGHIKNGVDIAITKIDSKNGLPVQKREKLISFFSYTIVIFAGYLIVNDLGIFDSTSSSSVSHSASISANKSNSNVGYYKKIDSGIIAIKHSTNPFELRKLVGGNYETQIFVEHFEDEGNTAFIIDANFGFYCRMLGTDFSQHNKRGTMVVRGSLAESKGRIGLNNCTFLSNDTDWKPE